MVARAGQSSSVIFHARSLTEWQRKLSTANQTNLPTNSDNIREGLDLYSEYDGDNVGREYAREVNFCKLLRYAMIVCNELGSFWAYRLQFPKI
jgi:hypothetical protein